MNNFEIIRNMTVQEMAEFLHQFAHTLTCEVQRCTNITFVGKPDYDKQLHQWLLQEVE